MLCASFMSLCRQRINIQSYYVIFQGTVYTLKLKGMNREINSDRKKASINIDG